MLFFNSHCPGIIVYSDHTVMTPSPGAPPGADLYANLYIMKIDNSRAMIMKKEQLRRSNCSVVKNDMSRE